MNDVKVIPGEEVALQHQLLVCDFLIYAPRKKKKKFVPRLKIWKLKDPQVSGRFLEEFSKCTDPIISNMDTDEIWNHLKNGLLETTEKVCGKSKPHRWRDETWWWNDSVDSLIKAKRQAFKAWKKGTGPRSLYDDAKRRARRAVHQARLEADKTFFEKVAPGSDNTAVFRLAKQLRRENADVVGEKPVRNDNGELALDDESLQKAWVQHYERLLNVEFDWDPSKLSDVDLTIGSPITITADMVRCAISRMKSGKAAGPSGVVIEMIAAAGDRAIDIIRDLIAAIIESGRIPKDWEESFIVCLFKGKGDALDRGNYRGLKLTEHAMKILERIIDNVIREKVNIDECQFGFVPGRGTTDAIFVLRQLHEKYRAAGKNLYMAFVDLEKAFDRVPRKVIWWSLRKLGVEEWVVKLVQGMYHNARSRVCVGNGQSEEFEVKVGVHQGSVLSPLLFIVVLEALSQNSRAGVPWENLYADDLVIISESLEDCTRRLLIWKEQMELKGLRVNAGKTKIMICGSGMDTLTKSGKFPCAVCLKGVGCNSILCSSCNQWVHGAQKCSGLKRIKEDPNYICLRCKGEARPIDGRPQKTVNVGSDVLEIVSSFCYLGDMQSAAGGCTTAAITRVKSAWSKFNELLPVLTSRHLSLKRRGHLRANFKSVAIASLP